MTILWDLSRAGSHFHNHQDSRYNERNSEILIIILYSASTNIIIDRFYKQNPTSLVRHFHLSLLSLSLSLIIQFVSLYFCLFSNVE